MKQEELGIQEESQKSARATEAKGVRVSKGVGDRQDPMQQGGELSMTCSSEMTDARMSAVQWNEEDGP